jgi:tRNA dimethylallyltransferase
MKTLVVLTGPTSVGKTKLSLGIAQALGSPVLSCDSRQIFRELSIGTAAPTKEQLQKVQHYFIGTHSIQNYYSAAKFETDVIQLLENKLFPLHESILMTGGSMMYIDAVCKGIDDMPDVNQELRMNLQNEYKEKGLHSILSQLSLLDPDYYSKVDKRNAKRVIHGLEICLTTGQPFSSFRKEKAKKRPFKILKICLNRDRKELYTRIDQRVLKMINLGLVQEARDLYPYRQLNALNTVGYKELFACFEGSCTLEEAIVQIRNDTHKYARKQLTWFRKDPDYKWFHPDDKDGIRKYLTSEGITLRSEL